MQIISSDHNQTSFCPFFFVCDTDDFTRGRDHDDKNDLLLSCVMSLDGLISIRKFIKLMIEKIVE